MSVITGQYPTAIPNIHGSTLESHTEDDLAALADGQYDWGTFDSPFESQKPLNWESVPNLDKEVALETPKHTWSVVPQSTSEDDEPYKWGMLPQGKTIEKVLLTIAAVNLTLTLAAGAFLVRLNQSVGELHKLTEEKRKKMMTQAVVMTTLGVLAGVATGAGGFSGPIAESLNNNRLTAESIKGIAETASKVLDTGNSAYKTFSDSQQATIDNNRNIEQSVVLSASQQANSEAERQRDALNQQALSIIQADNRSAGG